jgi:DNA-binding transcriptional LysR family regulator
MNRLAVMETFIRVVETGSFSTAAKHLNVGQPAISKSIAQLEQRLGVRLLVRSTRGLMPTEAGQTFCKRARRAIDEANEAELEARGAGASLSGRLRVSAPLTFASLHIVPRLPIFLAAHPDLTIDLVLDDRAIDIMGEGVDIALRMGALPDSTLTVRKLAASRRLVLGAPGYFAQAGIPTTPAELTDHAAIIYAHDNGGDTWTFRQGETETSVALQGRLRVSGAEGVRAAVVRGMGIVIASEWMFAPELASGAVRAVLTDWALPAINLWAAFPTGRMAPAKARAFADFVEAELKGSRSAYPFSPSSALGSARHLAAAASSNGRAEGIDARFRAPVCAMHRSAANVEDAPRI